MKRINDLSDFLMEEMAGLLDAENQLVEALPKMSDASEWPVLKTALEKNLNITKQHTARLQDILRHEVSNLQASTCKTMKGLIEESQEVVRKIDKGQACDAALISVSQRVEEYKIARYKAVREHAADLAHTRIVESLTEILNDERAINLHLNELAQGMINVQAIEPSSKSGER